MFWHIPIFVSLCVMLHLLFKTNNYKTFWYWIWLSPWYFHTGAGYNPSPGRAGLCQFYEWPNRYYHHRTYRSRRRAYCKRCALPVLQGKKRVFSFIPANHTFYKKGASWYLVCTGFSIPFSGNCTKIVSWKKIQDHSSTSRRTPFQRY